MSKEPVRVGLTVMIVKNSKILLGERGDECELAPGQLAFPGGRMDYGELPEKGILREVFEETGLILMPEDITFLRYCNEFFPEQGKHYVSLVFIADAPKEEPVRKEKNKCKGWHWTDPNNMPDNVFPPTRETIMMNIDKIVGLT